jgi:hypothetical protein
VFGILETRDSQEQCKLTKVSVRVKLIIDKVCRSAVSMNTTYYSPFIHVKRGSAFHIHTKYCFVDLKEYTIGVIRGDSFEKEMTRLGMKTTPSNTPDLCIKMLRNGRVDFYIGEIVSIIEMTRRLYPSEVSNFKFLPYVYDGKKQNTLIVSKKFPDAKLILDLFNKGASCKSIQTFAGFILSKFNQVVSK